MRYWLTPPELEPYKKDRFDPCPFPRPDGWDALSMDWEKPWYANPPFLRADGGLLPFVKKAICEGGPGFLVHNVRSRAMELMLQAGWNVVWVGFVPWLECDTLEPMKRPSVSVVWEAPASRSPPAHTRVRAHTKGDKA